MIIDRHLHPTGHTEELVWGKPLHRRSPRSSCPSSTAWSPAVRRSRGPGRRTTGCGGECWAWPEAAPAWCCGGWSAPSGLSEPSGNPETNRNVIGVIFAEWLGPVLDGWATNFILKHFDIVKLGSRPCPGHVQIMSWSSHTHLHLKSQGLDLELNLQGVQKIRTKCKGLQKHEK